MRSLARVTRGSVLAAPVLLAAVLLAAVLAGPAASAATAGPARPAVAQAPVSGGCSFQPVNGGWQWVCTNTTSSPGRPGTGGGGDGSSTSACTLTPVSQTQAAFLGLQWPAPKGHTWETITCPGNQRFGGVTLVSNATGAPAVTPQQLAQIAIGELIIPTLEPATAPPRGKEGLVGLPEWFWIPANEWGPVSKTVTAGPVWARATATPVKIALSPGGGLSGVTCAGPGTAYQPSQPLSAQHTTCSYTYTQPSAGQPNNMYAASVTVFWNVSWVGSGGSGGVVATGRPVSTPMSLPIAAGEALVTSK
jgi:hypothetical protein